VGESAAAHHGEGDDSGVDLELTIDVGAVLDELQDEPALYSGGVGEV